MPLRRGRPILMLKIVEMTANCRILMNVVAAYWRSAYALVIGLFCGW